jgi:hypothetical protein
VVLINNKCNKLVIYIQVKIQKQTNMYFQKLKSAAFIMCLMAVAVFSKAQQGTLELTSQSYSNLAAVGPTSASQTVTFREDIQNLNVLTHFKTYANTLTANVGFQNQQFTTNYFNINRGIVFGGGNSSSVAAPGVPQQSAVRPIFNTFGADFPAGPPQSPMYVTSPSGTVVTQNYPAGLGVGFDVDGNQFGFDDDISSDDNNYGFALFTNVEPLFDAGLPANNTRYYYGDMVITFNRPVKNPVLHFAGMGGSYNYQPRIIAGNPVPAREICYFTSEFDIVNATSTTRMSGNEFFSVNGTNQVLNSNTNTPNAGCIDNGSNTNGFNNYGAAAGSVRINGNYTQITLRVYVRGIGQFNFSKNQADIDGATRDPLNGDFFRMSISLDKPTQQISGYVFNDRDGLTDNNINQSVGVANPKTNVGGILYANLLNAAGTTVVATVPVGADGAYLFDNVPVGTYSVQLTTNQGVVGQPTPATALPAGWINTGENGSNAPGNGIGSDGTVNGRSASITVNANDIKPEVNFGIERIPESVDFLRIIPSPSVGTVMTLSPNAPYPLPPLTGSDPEDQATSGTLAGKNVRITTVPNNATLRYNGVVINNGDLITSFNPDLFTITFNGPAQANSQFNYAYVDAAGVQDPTPALYRLVWSGGPLAITLNNFTAVKNNCTADLTWSTASEINASRFEVEITTNNNVVYNKVGSVNATASNGSGKTYQFSYPMQPNTQYYFRLKMIDKDGSFKYSDVRPLMSCEGKGVITIAPNPVIDRFSIAGMENGKNTIVIYAANGQQVKTQIIPQAQGYVYIQNLAAGMYSVKVISEKGNVTVGKIIKK